MIKKKNTCAVLGKKEPLRKPLSKKSDFPSVGTPNHYLWDDLQNDMHNTYLFQKLKTLCT